MPHAQDYNRPLPGRAGDPGVSSRAPPFIVSFPCSAHGRGLLDHSRCRHGTLTAERVVAGDCSQPP